MKILTKIRKWRRKVYCNDCKVRLTELNEAKDVLHYSCQACALIYKKEHNALLKEIEEDMAVTKCPLCEPIKHCVTLVKINGQYKPVRPEEFLLFDQFLEWKKEGK